MTKDLELISPGEILNEEFLRPFGISQNKLARDLDVPVARVNDIVRGKRGISADTALRLSAYFGTSAAFWLNLQTRHDLAVASAEVGAHVKRTVRPYRSAA